MAVSISYTGRFRYRTHKRLFRSLLLVVQVEEHHKGWYTDPHPMGGTIDVDRKIWRDATTEDLLLFEQFEEVA